MAYDDVFSVAEKPNEVVIAVGPEGSGKTHFAATAPEPLHVIGTESGHEVVTLLKSFPDADIRHFALRPSADGEVQDIWFGNWFGADEKLTQAVEVLSHHAETTGEGGTVIIDSASDLLGIAAAGFNMQLQRGDNPIPPMMYGQLYPLLQGWITRLREHYNVVLCCRTKAEYENDEKTGNEVIDLWKTGPYLAEHIIWIQRAPIGAPRIGAVTKGDNDGRLIYNPTWSDVVSPMSPEEDARPMRYALNRLQKAYAYFESLGNHLPRVVPSTYDEVMARVNELAELAAPPEEEGEGEEEDIYA
jgi:hypothetical protein